MDLTGKVAVVTGGGNRTGRATALVFVRGGAHVVVVDRVTAGGAETAAESRAGGGEAVVTKSADVATHFRRALDLFGRIDCFDNNAGIEGKITNTADYAEDDYDAVIVVNAKGVFLGMRHVLPVMIAQGGGAVVKTASVAGLAPSAGMVAMPPPSMR